MTSEGHLKICDFGLVVEKIIGAAKTKGVVGTRKYMAPEVFQTKKYGASADWWSFGVTLYQMLVGRVPVTSSQPKREYRDCTVHNDIPYPSWLLADQKDILMKLLLKDPECRLGTNGDIRVHPFFGILNWDHLEQRKIWPPYLPLVNPTGDLHLSSQDISFSFVEGANCNKNKKSWDLPDLSFVSPKWRE
ncbi:protein kinase C theta type-like [Spea bombifrons]|uniref:protein kinase C theta type-like n=2 Tax=Spea bombifrons TaxID=233779 RepID=UPI00234AED21|nr:protein kinase C theta type-like [Spea bombifrons]